MFLTLLPPSTRAQCLAMKIAIIMELLAFADYVYCQLTVTATVVAIDPEPDVDLACAMTIRRPLNPQTTDSALCFYHRR